MISFPAQFVRMVVRSPFLIVVFVLATMPSFAIGADTVPRALQKQIPSIIRYLNERQLKTVGVLKFRVKKGDEKLSDSVGPLNSLMADRLEVGLILGNPFDENRTINVIRNASAQVAEMADANHLTAAGRAAFFQTKYDLSWGDEKAPADAFLTGIVSVHPDNRNVTIGILCFDRDGSGLEKACDIFDATLDASLLGELGESFVLRGAFDGGSTKQTQKSKPSPETVQEEAIKQAAAVKSQLTSFPLKDSSAPVKLEIMYDGQQVPVETRDGRAFVREPEAGQKVEIALVRNPESQDRVAVVLKVNGENTLYRQTVSDLECSKWILSKEHVRTVVRGYQIDGANELESFEVLSRSESEQRAIDYGRNVGQIQVTVFREENLQLADDLPPAIPDEDEEDLAAMLRGIQPEKSPKNLSALKHQLRLAGRDEHQTRGLIVQGQKADNEIRVVTFTPDPTPVMSATITYFRAGEE